MKTKKGLEKRLNSRLSRLLRRMLLLEDSPDWDICCCGFYISGPTPYNPKKERKIQRVKRKIDKLSDKRKRHFPLRA